MNVVFFYVSLQICVSYVLRLLFTESSPWLLVGWRVRCSVQMVNLEWKSEGREERQEVNEDFGHFVGPLSFFFRILSKCYLTMKKKHFNGYRRSKQYFIIFQDLWEFKLGGFDNVEEVRCRNKNICYFFFMYISPNCSCLGSV